MFSFRTERNEDSSSLIKKANAVLTASGLNASFISIQQLNVTFPVIMVKIFESLFHHKLEGINYFPSNTYDHVKNSDIVLQGLRDRCPQVTALKGINGSMLVKGDKPSIEIMVDLFYGISQNMMNRLGDPLENELGGGSPANYEEKVDSQHGTPYQSVQRGELQELMAKVSYLESKLKVREDEMNDMKSKKKKKKSVRGRLPSPSSQRKAPIEPGMSQYYPSNPIHPPSRPLSSRHGEVPSGPSVRLTRRRPNSAPTGRPRQDKTPLANSPPLSRNLTIAKDNKLSIPDMSGLVPPEGRCSAQKRNQQEVGQLFTYDTWTGRRVLRREIAQLIDQRKQRGQHRSITPQEMYSAGDAENDGHACSEDWSRPNRTMAEFPGIHTAKSYEMYLQKMYSIRHPTEKDPYEYLDKARLFRFYNLLKPLDIVISVEHCHSCDQHPTTLRHKTGEYRKHANQVLRSLAMSVHSARSCARVGVICINADIQPMDGNPAAHLRIGAFEVQVCFKDYHGMVHVELLHSKLKTRRWPSKRVLERRMVAFFSKVGVQSYEEKSGASYNGSATEGLHQYPVGVGAWSECLVSSDMWTYNVPAGVQRTLFASIQWAFDSSEYSHYPKFAVGTTVRVFHAPNEWGGLEKYSCAGVVKRAFKDETENMLGIRMRYQHTETVCLSSMCATLVEDDECPAPDDFEFEGEMPAPLAVVLSFAHLEGFLEWQHMSSDDRVINKTNHKEVYLSRSSFYNHVRALTWLAIDYRPGSVSGCMAIITPNGEEKDMDVQVAYSEAVLDWAMHTQGNGELVNTYELMKLLPARHPSPCAQCDPFSYTDEDEPVSFLRRGIQAVCLGLCPPVKSDNEVHDSLEKSQYRPGAQVLFDKFDNVRNGSLDKESFGRALDSFGVTRNKQDLDKLWSLLDLHGDNCICLPELVSFLHYSTNFGYKKLCEIKDIMRYMITNQSNGPSSLEEVEKEMFSMCHMQDGVGLVLSLEVFKSILKKFGSFDVLRPGDMKVLVAYHGVDAQGRGVTKSILGDQSTETDLEMFNIRFDDFCLWLEPMDCLSLCKGLSRKLQSALEYVDLAQVKVMSGEHTVGAWTKSWKEIPVHHTEVPVIQNPSIIITPQNCPYGMFIFKTRRMNPRTFSLKTECTAGTGWKEDLQITWEMFRLEDHVERIPISSIDPERVGFVEKHTFKIFLDSIGITLSDAELRLLFRNFGEDGDSMTFDQLRRLLTADVATHRCIPLIGSPACRKNFFAKCMQKRRVDDKEIYRDDFDQYVPDDQTTLTLTILQVELTGEAISAQTMRNLDIEIKYLMQKISVNANATDQGDVGRRLLVDLSWDPLLLTAHALRMNAAICVVIKRSSENVGIAYFSPQEFLKGVDRLVLLNIVQDVYTDVPSICRNHPQQVLLDMSCGDAGGMKAVLTCRVDSVQTPSEYQSNIEEDVMYQVRVHQVSAEDLPNKGMFKFADLFIKFTFGHVWVFRSSVQRDAGSEASWKYESDDPDVVFQIKGSELLSIPLLIEVYDHNIIRSDELLGSGSGIVRFPDDTEIALFSGVENKPAGKVVVQISFTPFSHEPQLQPVPGEQTMTHGLPRQLSNRSSSGGDTDLVSDRDILLNAFNSCSESGTWRDTCFWREDVKFSRWLNIDLNSNKDRVTGLRLGSIGLTGTVPKSLHKLQMLTTIDLSANGLMGSIPSEIGELVHLKTLLLNHNSLTGSIPAALAKCINLEELDLSCNLLTGRIPEDLAIQGLMVVKLSSNQLEGAVPLSFTRCKRVHSFLCDEIPYQDDEFYKTYDWIRSQADISRKVGNIVKYQSTVRHVKVKLRAFSSDMESGSNCFAEWQDTKEINMWPGVCVDGTGNLQSLNLSNTFLRGLLSSNIEQLRNLVYLDLSSNALGGFIPDELTTLTSIKFLYLNNNSFEGSLPSALHHMTNLKTLHVGHNHLSGKLSVEWKRFVHLEILNLSSNEFEGGIIVNRLVVMLMSLAQALFPTTCLHWKECGSWTYRTTLSLVRFQISPSYVPWNP